MATVVLSLSDSIYLIRTDSSLTEHPSSYTHPAILYKLNISKADCFPWVIVKNTCAATLYELTDMTITFTCTWKNLHALKCSCVSSFISVTALHTHTNSHALTLEGLLVWLTDLITWVDGASTPRWRNPFFLFHPECVAWYPELFTCSM